MPAPNVTTSFQALFRVPRTHRLLEIRSQLSGGVIERESWLHREYDTRGELVAEYESYVEWNRASGVRQSGWLKLDPEGQLLEQRNDLDAQDGPRSDVRQLTTACALILGSCPR